MLLQNGELNSSAVLEMDNCFGGLASPVPAVITMAGTFLWKRFVRFDIILLKYVYICENPLRGGATHGSCQGSGQPAGSNH